MDAVVAIGSGERRSSASSHAAPVTSMPRHRHASEQHRGSSQSDGRDAHVQTPPQHHVQRGSSPTAASVDSFASYINKDAPLFQNRSSSPRVEDQLRDNSDPASHASSPRPQPRHLVTTPIVSRDAFRHQPWPQHDLPRTANSVMSIEHLHTSTTSHLPRHLSSEFPVDDLAGGRDQRPGSPVNSIEMAEHAFPTQRRPASPSPAIDVNRLSESNLAQKNQEDDAAEESVYGDSLSRAPASVLADDSFDSTASVLGEDSKNEIRRRRRTRPDEANLLAQVYAKNPFPDHETRLFLANKVQMSVRAVSVWFQNRRQAEKKRSGRYGGSGIVLPASGPSAPTGSQATPSVDSPSNAAPVPVPMQRKPLGNAFANGAGQAKQLDMQDIKDLSSNNKENIPPWLEARSADSSLQRCLEKIKREVPLASLNKEPVVAPRPAPRDLRQAVGPEGVGIAVHRVEVDQTVPVQPATAHELSTGSSKASLSRHRSVPRLSLEDVLSGRSKSLRRSATENGAPLATASSEPEPEQLDTILPAPKLLSRASSSSSLSLVTTSGGRASIGSLGLHKEPSPVAQAGNARPSLTSSLPPKLTAALQRQGIIAMQPEINGQDAKGQGLLQMMPSSSASSSEADALYGSHQGRDSEEDEERTLKMIAQRRAAKAQAAALAKAQEARERAASAKTPERAGVVGLDPMNPGCADARQAIVQQAGLLDGASVVGGMPKTGSSTVVGLAPARQLSLDWAAGRDRAATSALPKSIGGTPLSRSVSARQLTMPRPNESTPMAAQRNAKLPDSAPVNGEKRKSNAAKPSRRSLSATDLTRRLQQAKRKGDAAQRSLSTGRKRTAAAAAAASLEAGDENVDLADAAAAAAAGGSSEPAQPVKRRRAQLEDIVLASSMAEPVLSAKAAAPLGVGMAAPASPLLSSRPFLPHASFPSASRSMPTMVLPSTPQSSSLYASAGIPLSTRSDRFRAIGASPAGPLGRSISANYTSHRPPAHHQLPRSSAARDQGPSRGWDLNSTGNGHARTYSNNDDGWTPRSVGGSLSQPLPASTPSRVLGDRTNFASTPAFHHHHRMSLQGNSSGDSPFLHDDSGFFEGMSDDDEAPRQEVKKVGSKGLGSISPRKASLRSMRGAESGDDRQAAELLLGLGKTVGSRDSSSSQ